jgi:hypothetical protein
MGGACGTHGRHEQFIQILVGEPEERRSLGRFWRIWEDIRIDLRELW